MPPELQRMVDSLLQAGAAYLVVAVLGYLFVSAWLVFVGVLTVRAGLVAWRWLGIAEVRAAEAERALKIRGNNWGVVLLATYLTAFAVPLAIGLLAMGQPGGWIVLLVMGVVWVIAVIQVAAN